uniref:Capsid protein n=1 Tax=Dicistroviridae sp. squirrel/UK/2011 TaxID=2804316 RepID=A0A7U0F332_9VIRU|nr:capsid protein [Dicistroviridae sp. squirrel/UK/2011]
MSNYMNQEGQGRLWNCRPASAYAKFQINYLPQIEYQSEMEYLGKKTDAHRQEDLQEDVGTTVRSTNDAVAETATFDRPMSLPNTMLSSPDDGVPASVKSFLAKPVPWQQGLLALTDTAATFPNFPTSAPLRYNKTFSDKLSGVMSMRYTVVFTLQVNANRFQQGRYVLAFVPTGGALYDATNLDPINDYLGLHRSTKTEITQLHHVELDVNTDTSVQLRIPYISAYPSLAWNPDLAAPYFGDPGVVFLYPYSPLNAPTGNTTASYTIWAHYEDVEVFGNTIPTAASVYPPAPGPAIESQAGRVRKLKRDIDLFDREIKETGPISSGLSLIADGFSQFTKVPLLTSVSAPLGWSIRAASNIAASVGWSKPPVLDKVVRMNRFPHSYMTNEDQADDTQPLSLFSDNHVSVAPGFSSTDNDEMSINYLKSIFSWFVTVPWLESQVLGTEIYKKDISPFSFVVPDAVTPAVSHYTPVGYLAQYFNRYTGGFVIKIKVVKTEFHSGRLLFVFNPSESSCFNNDSVYADANYLHKTILDIREQNEFIIEIPYVSIIPWRTVANAGTPGSTFGQFKIYVLDELVAPETVSSQIELLIEVAGAPDLQFSTPRRNRLVPYGAATFQMDFSSNSRGDVNSDASPTTLDVNMVGGTSPGENTMIKDEMCVGEVVTSLRTLLKRGGFLGFTTQTSATTQNIILLPYGWRYTKDVAASETEYTMDIFSSLSAIYALVRGGVRIRQPMSSASGLVQARLDILSSDTPNSAEVVDITNTSSTNFIESSYNAQYAMTLQQLGGIGLQVPFYHYTHSSCTLGNALGPTNPQNHNINKGSVQTALNIQYSPAMNYRANPFYRSGADDCNFGAFVSMVPMVNLPYPT